MSRFAGSERVDRHRMDVGSHQILDSVVYRAMAIEFVHPDESGRDDHNREVTTAVADARMALMAMTVVDDLDSRRLECGLQAVADPVDARGDGHVGLLGLHGSIASVCARSGCFGSAGQPE